MPRAKHTCPCGKPAFKVLSGEPVCKSCFSIEQRMYGKKRKALPYEELEETKALVRRGYRAFFERRNINPDTI